MSTSPEIQLEAGKSPRPGVVRRSYDWVLGWADRPGGTWALFWLAFAESSFFPIPPDVLLMALAIGRPRRALFFAGVCTLGSVLGGIAGYYIGMFAFEAVGRPVINFYNAQDAFLTVERWYAAYGAWALAVAAFTPIPYKVFTIASGVFAMPLFQFLAVSALGRAGRFFLVAGLIYLFGPRIRGFIDRYFNLLTIVFVVLLILGFAVLKFVGD